MSDILVIEDNPLAIRGIKRAFKDKPHDLTFCEDGKEAVEWLKHNHPDLVLVDLKLPKLNGFEVIRQSMNGHKFFAVAMTSSDNESDIEEFYAAGGYGYVVKPVNYDDVIGAIEQFVFHPNFRRPVSNE